VDRIFAEEPDGFLIVCNRDRELFRVLQTRVESIRQIHAGVRERTLRDGVRSRGDKERHDGAIRCAEVRGAIDEATTRGNLNIDICRVARGERKSGSARGRRRCPVGGRCGGGIAILSADEGGKEQSSSQRYGNLHGRGQELCFCHEGEARERRHEGQ